jgi:centractin
MDLRRTLYQNVVLSGGSTLFRGKIFDARSVFVVINRSMMLGFGDRLLGELKRIAPKEVKIKISAPRERLYSTWIG